jgi:hypothetical protein
MFARVQGFCRKYWAHFDRTNEAEFSLLATTRTMSEMHIVFVDLMNERIWLPLGCSMFIPEAPADSLCVATNRLEDSARFNRTNAAVRHSTM